MLAVNKKIFNLDFYKRKNVFFLISVAVIVVGILASVIIKPKLDIQFAGGAMIRYSVEGGEVSAEALEDTIKTEFNRDASVTVNEGINSNAKSVTVSFAGNDSLSPDEQTKVAETLTTVYDDLTFTLLESNSVDATMGAKFFQKCLVCFALTTILMLVYITLRFRKIGGFSAGITAVIALLHDVLISFCVFVVFGLSINDIFIGVVLTILGYSINSTIVIYDRVRENKRKLGPKAELTDVMNLSLNQTLGRTICTSLTTFLAILVVLIVAMVYNISSVVSFALPMLVGVVAGCFSSQFIAPNIFAMWQIHKQKRVAAASSKR